MSFAKQVGFKVSRAVAGRRPRARTCPCRPTKEGPTKEGPSYLLCVLLCFALCFILYVGCHY